MKLIFNQGILPLGFKAAGISAGIRKGTRRDLALFYSQTPCAASAMFTSNVIKAAPIEVSRLHLKKGAAQAVIVNSGIANCMTGWHGMKDALMMTELVAKGLSLSRKDVLVSSTGIIGKTLPMNRIKRAVPRLIRRLSGHGLSDAAGAILTTDTFAKKVCAKVKIGKKVVTISGVAKGAGMIAPSLKKATMLAYVFTDANINKSVLDRALRGAVEVSFNAITVDGCMSTNDTVIAMANGKADNKSILLSSKEGKEFSGALKEVCLELAKMIVRDGEGATKFIEVKVKGALNAGEAKRLAFSVANSNLFKCAIFGSDPNWGRIAAALGSTRSGLRWEKLDIFLNNRAVFKNGKPVLTKHMALLGGKTVKVLIDLHLAKAQATVYASDLSYRYVRINADYN